MRTRWTRDRSRGPPLSVEEIVRRQTSHTAQVCRLHDRGLLRVGLKADSNLIDCAHLPSDAPCMACDLPVGGKRLLQQARGYLATIVACRAICEDGELTGALPGALLRGRPV